MQIDDALNRIAEIHDHLDKCEVYRGYRALPVALSGITALLGATLQPYLTDSDDTLVYVLYWLNIAVINTLLCGSSILMCYFRDSTHRRRQARKTLGQFIPCLLAGALVTIILLRIDSALALLLPGLWAILFGLGIFSSRPYLPKAAGWIGVFYFTAGGVLLLASDDVFSPWSMGTTFGFGQLAAAAMLYWGIERKAYD